MNILRFRGLVVLSAVIALAGCIPIDEHDFTKTVELETCHLVRPYNVAAPVFSWKMESPAYGARQTAYRLTVQSPCGQVVWDSGEVASDVSVGVRYAGPALKSGLKYTWTVRVKDERGVWLEPVSDTFETALLEKDGWAKAKFITVDGKPTGGADTMSFLKTIVNAKKVRQVYWFTTGLGVYDAYANGANITHLEEKGEDKEFLKPGFTHYAKRRHAFGYDITHQVNLKAGEKNVYAAWVTGGWWSDQPNGRRGKRNAFAGVMIYRYADGTEERFFTDASWKGAYGKSGVTHAGIFEGQDEDARIDLGWMKSGDETDFKQVVFNDEFKGEIVPLQGSPVRLRFDREIRLAEAYVYRDIEGADSNCFGRVVKLRSYKAGEPIRIAKGETLIVDFGQNLAGKPNFTLSAAAGAQVKVNFAEMLNDDMGKKARHCDGPEGSLYRQNYRSARSELNLTCSGRADDLFHTKYSFFGFRYISIRATDDLLVKDVFAIPLTSVLTSMERGTIVTGDADVNKLVSNGFWGMYSNYLSVPTDCPQRDERLGWAADTQVFAKTACYNAEVYGFLSKWMADMRDSQHATGGFPGVAPLAQYGDNDAAVGWADAGIIVPYTLWKMYGDTGVLEENWDAMERYMEFVRAHNGPNPEPWGEWLAYERNDRKIQEYLAHAFGVWDAMMMREMALALGRESDAGKYAADERKLRAFILEKCFERDGTLKSEYGGQAACLYALHLDLVSGAAKEATVKALVDNIRRHGDKLQTGFLGTAILMDTLTKVGRDDIAYALLFQRGNPSWLYSVDQGATTYWERWNSYTKESGFGSAGMNSFNHYAYGAVVAWMYGRIAGIREDVAAPGFKHFFLAPAPDRRVGFCRAAYDSAYGRITSEWNYGKDGLWTWTFTVPANTTATVTTPDGETKEYQSGSYMVELTLD